MLHQHCCLLLSEVLPIQDALVDRTSSAQLLDHVHVEVILKDLRASSTSSECQAPFLQEPSEDLQLQKHASFGKPYMEHRPASRTNCSSLTQALQTLRQPNCWKPSRREYSGLNFCLLGLHVGILCSGPLLDSSGAPGFMGPSPHP